MQGCMAKRQKKDFTLMIRILSAITIAFLLLNSCSKNNINTDPIADVPVNITINMALPSYVHLLDPATFVYEPGGVKGVVVVHHTDDQYYAFDRNCSYQPNSSCSKIEVDSSVLIFRCGSTTDSGFVKCCDSKFWMDGQVFNGPATFGLKHYQVIKTGNVLNIKN